MTRWLTAAGAIVVSTGCATLPRSVSQDGGGTMQTDQSISLLRGLEAAVTGIDATVTGVQAESATLHTDVAALRGDIAGVKLAVGAIGEIKADLAAVRTTVGDIKTGGDFNDTWTLRLLVLSLAVTPLLGYVGPKLGWLMVQRRLHARGALRIVRGT